MWSRHVRKKRDKEVGQIAALAGVPGARRRASRPPSLFFVLRSPFATSDWQQEGEGPDKMDRLKTLSYSQRAEAHPQPLARRLLELMDRKKTNLILSVDVTSKAALLRIVEAVADQVCVVKVRDPISGPRASNQLG